MRGEWEIAAAIGALMRISEKAQNEKEAKRLANYACALEWALGISSSKEPCIGGVIEEAVNEGRSVYGPSQFHVCELEKRLCIDATSTKLFQGNLFLLN